MAKNLTNKESLVRKIFASDTLQNYKIKNNKLTLELVRTIYDELENQVIRELSEVAEINSKDNPITVKLFEGVTLASYYKPPVEKIPSFFKNNPDKCNIEDYKSKVGIKANVTRYFKQKISKINNDYLGR